MIPNGRGKSSAPPHSLWLSSELRSSQRAPTPLSRAVRPEQESRAAATVIKEVVGLVLIRVGRWDRSVTVTADGKHLMTDVDLGRCARRSGGHRHGPRRHRPQGRPADVARDALAAVAPDAYEVVVDQLSETTLARLSGGGVALHPELTASPIHQPPPEER